MRDAERSEKRLWHLESGSAKIPSAGRPGDPGVLADYGPEFNTIPIAPLTWTEAMSVPDVSPDLPPRSWRLILRLLGRLPQGALSRAFGAIADVPIARPLRRAVLGTFARAVKIDVAEAEHPLERYGTLNEFFVRRLRPGVRGWPEDGDVIASPVDGVVGRLGAIRDGRALQAKGRWYSVAELVGDPDYAARFAGGSFVTLYLSPRHYHRIHAPCGGSIARARHLPGSLLPVNAAAVLHVPDLFARNERLVCQLDGGVGGAVGIVAVGAYNVGRISAAFDPYWNGRREGTARELAAGSVRWATNRPGAEGVAHEYEPAVRVGMGEEIMAFHLGSTVVLLLEPGLAPLRPDLRPGAAIRLGEPLTAPRG